MVSVLSKSISPRLAVAQSLIYLPESVLLKVFLTPSNQSFPISPGSSPYPISSTSHLFLPIHQWIGPKGSLLSTCIIAGTLAAKQTPHLIPMCHSLPLDQVSIYCQIVSPKSNSSLSISSSSSTPPLSTSPQYYDPYRSYYLRFIVSSQCSGKTGVEMESLVGASLSTLTAYDMLKALSTRLTIEGTQLLLKTGGKKGTINYMDAINKEYDYIIGDQPVFEV
jgi:molybdenum cofactor biosynthesis enzyme